MKRELDYSYSPQKYSKTSQNDFNCYSGSFTKLEHLSNELFYEIFEYLDAYDLFPTFSNLSRRFQTLLNHSLLSFKSHRSKPNIKFDHFCSQNIISNSERVVYVHLSGKSSSIPFLERFFINSSFNRLQSLVVNDASINLIQVILSQLIFMPNLHTFKIALTLDFLADEYAEIISDYYQSPSSNSLVDNNHFSTIKHLNLDFGCTARVLTCILSYTPQVRQLICKNLSGNIKDMTNVIPTQLSYLTYFFIYVCSLSFTNLEKLIQHIACPLEIFKIGACYDETYYDADRWEQLIIKHLPQLRDLEFHYKTTLTYGTVILPDTSRFDRFHSLFWIQREWISEQYIDTNHYLRLYPTYSISPYRKKWYYPKNYIRSSEDDASNPSQDIELTLKGSFCNKSHLTYIIKRHALITVLHMVSSDVDLYQHTDKLIEILNFLPNLHSLRIKSYPSAPLPEIIHQQISVIHSLSHQNQINKVFIKGIRYSEEVLFFIHLCSHLEHLEIQCENHINLQSFILSILIYDDIRSHRHLHSFCVHSNKVDKQIVHFLQQMINDNKLFPIRTIKRTWNQIHLLWR